MSRQAHTFQGATFDEAYRAMRKTLGDDALVLRTAERRAPGLPGWLGRRVIELTASAPELRQPAATRKRSPAEQRYLGAESPPDKGPGSIEYYQRLIQEAQQRMRAPSEQPESAAPPAAAAGADRVVPFPRPAANPAAAQASLEREMREMREMLQVLMAEAPPAGIPPQFSAQYRELVERGMTRRTAAALVRVALQGMDATLATDEKLFQERLRYEIRRRVSVTGGIALRGGACKVVALCGATGVGKTTTIAKLAAWYAVRERIRVALITADTYRIAAAEQLRVYGNIIGIPLEVVNNGEEMARAIQKFRAYNLVLVDTAGGSQFNVKQIQELKSVLEPARPEETLLCLSANTQLEEMRAAVANFRCLGTTALCVTKLDETSRFGAVFSLLAETPLPLSYFTTGQNVPDDIVLAKSRMVARLIVGGGQPHA